MTDNFVLLSTKKVVTTSIISNEKDITGFCETPTLSCLMYWIYILSLGVSLVVTVSQIYARVLTFDRWLIEYSGTTVGLIVT